MSTIREILRALFAKGNDLPGIWQHHRQGRIHGQYGIASEVSVRLGCPLIPELLLETVVPFRLVSEQLLRARPVRHLKRSP